MKKGAVRRWTVMGALHLVITDVILEEVVCGTEGSDKAGCVMGLKQKVPEGNRRRKTEVVRQKQAWRFWTAQEGWGVWGWMMRMAKGQNMELQRRSFGSHSKCSATPRSCFAGWWNDPIVVADWTSIKAMIHLKILHTNGIWKVRKATEFPSKLGVPGNRKLKITLFAELFISNYETFPSSWSQTHSVVFLLRRRSWCGERNKDGHCWLECRWAQPSLGGCQGKCPQNGTHWRLRRRLWKQNNERKQWLRRIIFGYKDYLKFMLCKKKIDVLG